MAMYGEILNDSYDSTNTGIQVVEQLVPGAEDNTNNVIATQNRPVVSSLYSGTPGHAEDDADVSVKAAPGNLLSVVATNENAAVRYLQVHNKASAPGAGETAVVSYLIPAGSGTAPGRIQLNAADFGINGLHCTIGVALGISTAIDTFTAATAGECFLTYVYV
jgi:hypothetical protein